MHQSMNWKGTVISNNVFVPARCLFDFTCFLHRRKRRRLRQMPLVLVEYSEYIIQLQCIILIRPYIFSYISKILHFLTRENFITTIKSAFGTITILQYEQQQTNQFCLSELYVNLTLSHHHSACQQHPQHSHESTDQADSLSELVLMAGSYCCKHV